MPKRSSRVLCITLEPVRSQMAGPAIRCLELAKRLSAEVDVTIFSPRSSDLVPDGHNQRHVGALPGIPRAVDAETPATLEELRVHLALGQERGRLYKLAQEADVLFVQANVLKSYPRLAQMGKYLAVDLYDPYLLAVLAQYAENKSASASYRLMHQVLERHMLAADFAVCASERQRDYYLGRYCSLGRLTPEMYAFDPSFRKVIDVVPFGLPADEPVQQAHGIKGAVPGIADDDFVLLWGGGIWEWFDPLTVIQATARLSARYGRLKLFFMGWKSPNPQVPMMKMALRARELAQELGLLGKHVFFHDSWVPYERRADYLLDADVAVSAHFDLPETRFSFRTRILDYLWAGRAILTTCGDHLADTIQSAGAGIALPYGNVDAWTAALERIITDEKFRSKLSSGSKELSGVFHWDKCVEPLMRYCRQPHHLPRFHKVKTPSLIERAHAVYLRGGRQLVFSRTKELVQDILKR